jgi:hypothetical protein
LEIFSLFAHSPYLNEKTTMVDQAFVVDAVVWEVISAAFLCVGIVQFFARCDPDNKSRIRLVQKWFFPVGIGYSIIGILLFVDVRCAFGVYSITTLYAFLLVMVWLPFPGSLFWLRSAFETIGGFAFSAPPFAVPDSFIYAISAADLVASIVCLIVASQVDKLMFVIVWLFWKLVLVVTVLTATMMMTFVVRKSAKSTQQLYSAGSSNELLKVMRTLKIVSILCAAVLIGIILQIARLYPMRYSTFLNSCMASPQFRIGVASYSVHISWFAVTTMSYLFSWLPVGNCKKAATPQKTAASNSNRKQSSVGMDNKNKSAEVHTGPAAV